MTKKTEEDTEIRIREIHLLGFYLAEIAEAKARYDKFIVAHEGKTYKGKPLSEATLDEV